MPYYDAIICKDGRIILADLLLGIDVLYEQIKGRALWSIQSLRK